MTNLYEYINLPTWIYNSELIQTMIKDETFILNSTNDRVFILPKDSVFYLPLTFTDNTIVAILECIRYFGITDQDVLYKVFLYLWVKCDITKRLELEFPEFKELWRNVNYNSDDIVTQCDLHPSLAIDAVRLNCNYILRYLYEHKCLITNKTCDEALNFGNITALEFLYSRTLIICKDIFVYNFSNEIIKNTQRFSSKHYTFTNNSIKMVCECDSLECLLFIIPRMKGFNYSMCKHYAEQNNAIKIYKHCETYLNV